MYRHDNMAMWVYFEDFDICLGDQAYQVSEAVMTLQGILYPEASWSMH
jgi:hypothetical protein